MPESEHPPKSSRGRKVVFWAWALAASVVLMIVLLFVLQPDERFHPRSKEAVLKMDLKTMREAIDKYTLDRQKPPQSLQELVNANYLRAIPVDPMTGRRDWRAEFGDVPLSLSVVAKGISDVHSSSPRVSPLDGTPYNTW
jgi:general secretion pathway protein G